MVTCQENLEQEERERSKYINKQLHISQQRQLNEDNDDDELYNKSKSAEHNSEEEE